VPTNFTDSIVYPAEKFDFESHHVVVKIVLYIIAMRKYTMFILSIFISVGVFGCGAENDHGRARFTSKDSSTGL